MEISQPAKTETAVRAVDVRWPIISRSRRGDEEITCIAVSVDESNRIIGSWVDGIWVCPFLQLNTYIVALYYFNIISSLFPDRLVVVGAHNDNGNSIARHGYMIWISGD